MSALSGLSSIGSTSFNSIKSAVESVSSSSDDKELSSFKNILTDAIAQSEGLDDTANYDTLSMLTGNSDNLSDILIDAEKSELAVNLTVQVRNKAMDAYKEVMNMQV